MTRGSSPDGPAKRSGTWQTIAEVVNSAGSHELGSEKGSAGSLDSSSDSTMPWDRKGQSKRNLDASITPRSRSKRQNGWRGCLHDYVHTNAFEMGMLAVILVNAFHIGLQQSLELAGSKEEARWVEGFEHLFLGIYVAELFCRTCADGCYYFLNGWGLFDSTLVFLGVVHKWLLEPFAQGDEGFGAVMVLRTCRIFRLTKTVRFLMFFKELWMLVRGLLTAVRTMLYTLLMLAVMLFIFSTIGIEVITKSSLAEDPDLEDHIQTYFGTIQECMLTLLQFVTQDNMNLIYVPLVRRNWMLSVYFIAIILTVSIALMNLITAVIVNSALEEAMADKEIKQINEDNQRRKLMKQLRNMFIRLDEDSSGEVSLEELGAITNEEIQELHQALGLKDPIEIFKLLDVDGSGALGIDEFCEGIWEVSQNSGSLELKILNKQVLGLRKRVDKLFDEMSKGSKGHHHKGRHHRRAGSAEDKVKGNISNPGSNTPPPEALLHENGNNPEGMVMLPATASRVCSQVSGDTQADAMDMSPSGTIGEMADDDAAMPTWAKEFAGMVQKQVEELKIGVFLAMDSRHSDGLPPPDTVELLSKLMKVKSQAEVASAAIAPLDEVQALRSSAAPQAAGGQWPRTPSNSKFPSRGASADYANSRCADELGNEPREPPDSAAMSLKVGKAGSSFDDVVQKSIPTSNNSDNIAQRDNSRT
eukprot:CAMPEP_0178395678 /NCGR_PEP_ID=MMETSP0689_2-20121128/13342_1 /TAXON_ID=160604 /ORGANISM="Amphidinium massartii, Strain CS-259" /LENGTH=699 /DNA_ID=CAMNT_0020016339 /DNA_START=106 /DNA_END=2201 /DNA_ORIENTATION=-